VALSGSTLYVATPDDLISPNNGSVFKINTDGTGFTVLKQFTGDSDGGRPFGAPVLSGTTLFGTTYSGGNSNCGLVFKVNTDGTGFTVLKHFTGGSDGGGPYAGLVLADATLFGTTSSGVLKVNTDGSDFTMLLNVGVSLGPLVLSGATLYGTTGSTVFKINTDGRGFSVLQSLKSDAWGSLALCGAMLFGCTDLGGTSNGGTVFKVNTDGSDFAVLHDFNSTDGSRPWGGLMLLGTTLYGTAFWGGRQGSGIIFSISLPIPAIITAPQSQTAELGSTARLQVGASPSPLTYQWFFNGTNALAGVATNSWLELTNVRSRDCGAYIVAVTNAYGAVTSVPAMLNVIAPVNCRSVPGIKATGEAVSPWNVDYANSLSPAPNWTTIGSVSLTGTPQYCFDLALPLPSQRFYRAWQTGTVGVSPSLDLHLVPAITLTGTIGGSVRLDYINQFGPTDAWVTLATVPLTNTSQLYFDISAPGQPPRLYRLVPSP
jgi:uncharacterized repeat protein (TIGR03803 family)